MLKCITLLLSNSDFVVSFVRRQVNKDAHSIAKVALSHLIPHIIHDVSTTLYFLIINEM